MTTRRTPDGQVYTEVPVVPRHDQLDGRTLGNSHPISAITGLQEALDSKADAVDGGNLVTDEEKAKIQTMEANAQENTIEVIKVNGTALVPDASKAVDVEVPTAYGKSIAYSGSSGKLSLKGPTGSTLSEVTMPRKGLTAMALDSDTKVLTATLQDGSTVSVDLSDAADPYTAGNGLSLADGAFSLSSQTEGLLEDVADHLSDQTGHVSAADRTKWDGVASGAVRTTGNQTIAGSKTFSSPVTVAAPTAVSHAATKAYVDAAVEGMAADWTALSASQIGHDTFEGFFTLVTTVDNLNVYYADTDVQLCLRVDAQNWPETDGVLSVVIPKGSYVTDRVSATGLMGLSTSCTLRLVLGGVFTGLDMDSRLVLMRGGEQAAWGAMDCPLTYSETPFDVVLAGEDEDAAASVCIMYRPGGGEVTPRRSETRGAYRPSLFPFTHVL